jgi:hypothetical protein
MAAPTVHFIGVKQVRQGFVYGGLSADREGQAPADTDRFGAATVMIAIKAVRQD